MVSSGSSERRIRRMEIFACDSLRALLDEDCGEDILGVTMRSQFQCDRIF